MNHRMRRIVETLACERRYGIADAKGAEYSGAGSTYQETGADTLRNFKAVSERIGGTPEQVLMTYLLKHIDSITTAVREAGIYNEDENSDRVDARAVYAAGEGIVSRLDDARNYLDLLECLLIDNGHIEEVWDKEGEMYAAIGEGAAELNFPARQPYQYPGGHEDAVEAKLEGGTFAHLREGESVEFTITVPGGTPDPGLLAVQMEAKDQQEADLKNAGLVEGLDGVWRGKTTIDESVKHPGERQTPLYMQGVADPENKGSEHYGETGELA